MRVFLLCCVWAISANLAWADDKSPWFGSEASPAQQINTQTASTTQPSNTVKPAKKLCPIAGCVEQADLAKP